MEPDFDPDIKQYITKTTNATNTINITPEDQNLKVEIFNGEIPVQNGSSTTWRDGIQKLKINVGEGNSEQQYDVTVLKNAELPENYTFRSVAYGDGKIVAISGQKILVYDDQNSWHEPFSLPETTISFLNVCYGDGKFVIFPETVYSDKGLYSTDCENWIEFDWIDQESKKIPSCSSAAYGNGVFVACTGTVSTASNNRVIYSKDGINWKRATIPIDGIWKKVLYANGKFTVFSGNVVLTGTDGEKWEQVEFPGDNIGDSYNVTDGVYANGIYVCSGQTTKNAIYSYDLKSWNFSPDLPGAYKNIYYGNEKFFASLMNNYFCSEDGINWDNGSFPFSKVGNTISIYANGVFIVFRSSSNEVAYSVNGTDWIV